MEFSAEWKSRWTISSIFFPPLLLHEKTQKNVLGPLVFDANSDGPTSLLHSPSLSPPLPPPFPYLSLPKVLQKYGSIPSSATFLSPFLSPLLPDYSSHLHGFNSLQLIQIPPKNLVIAFFPTGENSDQVGFTAIYVKDGILCVNSRNENFFQVAKGGCDDRIRITQLKVNPVDDEDGDGGFDNDGNGTIVGFLMVSTKFAVYWYKVILDTLDKPCTFSVSLDYVGCYNSNMFKGIPVVGISWSPHLREECLVLLENGDLLMFNVSYSCRKKSKLMNSDRVKRRSVIQEFLISLNSKVKIGTEVKRGWFGLDFSWHPRIFIAFHCSRVFLIDSRTAGECDVSCLLQIETLSVVKNDGFVSFSRAGSDGFLFAVASRCLLFLCDTRKPFTPLLRWAHGLQNPEYITVVRLSKLRGNAVDNEHILASSSGHCILLGSFWDNEFYLFYYGPNINGNGSVSSEIAKFWNSYYAWGLPSEFSLSGCDCNCGSCILREDISKTSLPVWINWRQKKQLVTGFGVLDSDFSAQLSTPNILGGFTLIRLTSSGKLEAHQYHATWESKKSSETCRRKPDIDSNDDLFYARNDSDYYGQNKIQYLKLEYLNAYLNDELVNFVAERREKVKESDADNQEQYGVSSKIILRHKICEKFKTLGISRMRSSLGVSDVLKDINSPTSIHEIALRSIWATFPIYMLQKAFSTYANLLEDPLKHQEPLEFLDIPDQPQFPPFLCRKPSRRSNKWSNKVPRTDGLVGPLVPPQFLITLHKVVTEECKMERDLKETEEFSADSLLKIHCNKVMQAVEDHLLGSDKKGHDDDFVSLADDTCDYGTRDLKLSYHKPSISVYNLLGLNLRNPGYENDSYSTLVYRSRDHASNLVTMTEQELFDTWCPVELKFEDHPIQFGPNELEFYRNLKKQDLDFQKSFGPYQDYINNWKGT